MIKEELFHKKKTDTPLRPLTQVKTGKCIHFLKAALILVLTALN